MEHADTVLVFFIYGLASFAMGLAIVVALRRALPSPFASALRYLAVFGLLHGTAQWILMAQLIKTQGVTVEGNIAMRGLFLLFSALSALALLRFGSLLIAGATERLRWTRWLPVGLVAVWALLIAVPQAATAVAEVDTAMPAKQLCLDCHTDATAYITASRDPVNGIDIASRYLLFLPASLIAAVGLRRQSGRFGVLGLPHLARESTVASVVLVGSAAVTGLVVPPGPYPPASLVNYATVSDRIGFAPQLLWVAAAAALAVLVIRMLGIFEIERERQLEVAVTEERERIAREMHDGLAQSLGYVGLRSAEADEMLARRDVSGAKAVVNAIQHATDDAYRDVRASILELRSADVVDRGLRRCIEDYCDKFSFETGIAVNVDAADPRERPSPLVELQLIRIVQEALANVRKHAETRAAEVRLAWDGATCVLTVTDRGRGFSLPSPSRRPGAHFGLQTMRERAESLGGTLQIETAPSRGTRLMVTIPHAEGAG